MSKLYNNHFRLAEARLKEARLRSAAPMPYGPRETANQFLVKDAKLRASGDTARNHAVESKRLAKVKITLPYVSLQHKEIL